MIVWTLSKLMYGKHLAQMGICSMSSMYYLSYYCVETFCFTLKMSWKSYCFLVWILGRESSGNHRERSDGSTGIYILCVCVHVWVLCSISWYNRPESHQLNYKNFQEEKVDVTDSFLIVKHFIHVKALYTLIQRPCDFI